jgi:hypothetical protein
MDRQRRRQVDLNEADRGVLAWVERHWLLVTALSLIVIFAVACNLNLNDVDVFQGQGQTGAGASPSPGPQGGACEAATRLNAGVIGGGVVAVDSVERLDVTAFTASGREITGACAQAKNPLWAPFAGPCVFTTSATGFNPEFRGITAGSCSTSVTIDGVTAAVPITVQP